MADGSIRVICFHVGDRKGLIVGVTMTHSKELRPIGCKGVSPTLWRDSVSDMEGICNGRGIISSVHGHHRSVSPYL